MAFVLPTFNLQANVFTWSNPPDYTNPRLTTDCQLRAPSMTVASSSLAPPGNSPGMILLVPALTDIRDHFSTPGTHGDFIEVPAGSGRMYHAAVMDDVGKGFPNEHRFVVLWKIQFIQPVPFP
jgi:hypothetical protein